MRAPAVFVVTALALAACSAAPNDPGPSEDTVARAASAIINGELDTSHPAVVALILQEGQQGGICSGIIVKVDAARRVGWVATAAHCVDVPPVLVVQGEDFLAPDALRYEVLDYQADTRYTGQTGSSYDFAMVRIAGVDGSTPTIPFVSSPDGLASGTPVVSVGYGRTTLIGSGVQDENTKRRRVSRTLSQVGGTQIGYNMQSAGICQGDSGGPVLVSTSSGERVAGIHSYVQGDCNGFGVSGRVTAGASFWNAQLAKAIPAEDCSMCEKIANSGNGECATLTRSCLADKECGGFYKCLGQCGGTANCRKSCLTKFPKAEGPFTAAATCVCSRACADKCAGTLSCSNVPKCGYKFPAGDCSSCTEASCCDAAQDCVADGTCYLCLKNNDEDPACATNAARKKLATCVASSCKDECAGTGLDTGAEPQEEGGGGGEEAAPGSTRTVTTKEGCAVAVPGGADAPSGGVGAALALAAALAARRRRAA